MDEEMVLCAASSYEQKYYLNPEFESLPEAVKQELQIMCVLYTADVGGVLLLVFDENGNLELKVEHNEGDFSFDKFLPCQVFYVSVPASCEQPLNRHFLVTGLSMEFYCESMQGNSYFLCQ